MKAGIDFHLAYSPEREDPGREDASVKTIPKVVGGFTPNVQILQKLSTVRHWIKFTAFLPAKPQRLPNFWKTFFGV